MAADWVNVETIGTDFEPLSDPRHLRNRKHLRTDIVVIAVCGRVCGCDGPTAIHRWAAPRHEWLRPFRPRTNGIPSRDCIRGRLMALKPEAFQDAFPTGIREALPVAAEGPARLIAIGGTTCRRSHGAGRGSGPLHVVSAWATEEGIALGQVATGEKSNEITAIPELLSRLALTDTVATIDARGCQKEIAREIVQGGGDFVIAVKDNQPKRHEAIASHVPEHRERNLEGLRDRHHQTTDAGRGRLDERSYVLSKVPPDVAGKKDRPWIKAIGYSVRITRHADGRETDEVRYDIPSRDLSGKRFGEAVPGHWGIEAMHWV